MGGDKFYLHSLRELEPKGLPFDAGAPFFSPDGQWIGFMVTASGRPIIRKMALGGGPPGDVCGKGYVGATWAADGMIYFVSEVSGGLVVVAAAGRVPKVLVKIAFLTGDR